MSDEPPIGVITRHLRITGRVQGVGYRWSLAQEAKRLGLHGWVRNRKDGSVEAVVHGPAVSVNWLIGWAQQGPARAQVAGVSVLAVEGEFSQFEQRETA